jgi:peptidyl-prolyl cis-trans isomerase D
LRACIELDLKSQQAQRKYAEVADIFTNTVYEQADSLKPVADKLKLEIKTGDKVARNPLPGSNGVLANEKFLAAIFSTDSIEKKRNTEAIEIAVSQLIAGRVVAYQPARVVPLTEVRLQVREAVIASKAVELALKDGVEKLTAWKKDATTAPLPVALVVSRDQSQNVQSAILMAALRADPVGVPTWIGVDLGTKGYAVVRVNKVLPRGEVTQASAKQDRSQHAQWWTAAETQAYYEALKDRLKAQILVPNPAKAILNAQNSLSHAPTATTAK